MTRIVCIVFLLVSLAGCAARQAFVRGQEHWDAQRWESALASFLEARDLDPDDIEIRAAVAKSRERAVAAVLGDAATAMHRQQWEQAAQAYRRVLLLDPANDRAQQGLLTIETAQRHQDWFDKAQRAAAAGREREARAMLQKLLGENPSHSAARQALRAIDEKTGQTDRAPVLGDALRKPVSMVFRDATLKMVFDALSNNAGVNFVLDRDVRPDTRVSVFLREVTFDEALSQITRSNGLAQRVVNANTILIYPAKAEKIKEYQDLTVRNFFVANADVKQLTALLRNVLKIKDIHTDAQRNLIVVRDTPEQVALAAKIVAAHDQPEPEVMLEVEILEFNHTTDNQIGVRFPDQVTFGVANPITLNALRAINDSAISVSGLDASVVLNLKRQLGEIHTLANPRIRVRNREKAKFHIGDKVPVITSTTYPGSTTGATTSSVSYLDVGIKLEFEPWIGLDDDVVIKTSLEVSAITNTVVNTGTTAYQVGTRNAATTLTLRDGETQVLAGLYSEDESDTSHRLPGLGDVPVLGNLFRSRAIKGGRKEILLSITPRILRNLQRPTEDLLEFNAGPETAVSSGGMAPAPYVPPRPVVPTRATPMGGGVAPAPSATPTPDEPALPPSPGSPPKSTDAGAAPIEFEPPPGVGSGVGSR